MEDEIDKSWSQDEDSSLNSKDSNSCCSNSESEEQLKSSKSISDNEDDDNDKSKKSKVKEKTFEAITTRTKFQTLKKNDMINFPQEDENYKVISKTTDTLTIIGEISKKEMTITHNDYYKYINWRNVKIIFVDIFGTHDLIQPVDINSSVSQFIQNFKLIHSTNDLIVYYNGIEVTDSILKSFNDYNFKNDYLMISETPSVKTKDRNNDYPKENDLTFDFTLKSYFIISTKTNLQIKRLGFISKKKFSIAIEVFELSQEYKQPKMRGGKVKEFTVFANTVFSSDWHSKSRLIYSAMINPKPLYYDNDSYRNIIPFAFDKKLLLHLDKSYMFKVQFIGDTIQLEGIRTSEWILDDFALMSEENLMWINLISTRHISDLAFLD